MSFNPSKCVALLPVDHALVCRLEQEAKARMSDIVKADIETGAANGSFVPQSGRPSLSRQMTGMMKVFRRGPLRGVSAGRERGPR